MRLYRGKYVPPSGSSSSSRSSSSGGGIEFTPPGGTFCADLNEVCSVVGPREVRIAACSESGCQMGPFARVHTLDIPCTLEFFGMNEPLPHGESRCYTFSIPSSSSSSSSSSSASSSSTSSGGGVPPCQPVILGYLAKPGKVTLAWFPQRGTTGYRLHYTRLSTGADHFIDLAARPTRYTFKDLVAGESYALAVAAVNAFGSSIESSPVTVTIPRRGRDSAVLYKGGPTSGSCAISSPD